MTLDPAELREFDPDANGRYSDSHSMVGPGDPKKLAVRA